MKIILLIFSIYLLILPGLACAETGVCTDDLQSSLAQSGDHPEHENEDCDNFCNCSCCVHIVSFNFQCNKSIIDKPLVKSKFLSFYNNISLPSNFFGNIWQPPKSA